MFKVHFPATSYFNSLPKVHGSDVFLKALIVSRQIKKSALLHYRVGGENNQGFVGHRKRQLIQTLTSRTTLLGAITLKLEN